MEIHDIQPLDDLIGMSLKVIQTLKFLPHQKDTMKNRSFTKVLPLSKEMANMVQ